MASIDDALETVGFDHANQGQLRSTFGDDEQLREVAAAAPELRRGGFDRDDITELLARGYALSTLQRMSRPWKIGAFAVDEAWKIGAFAVEEDGPLSLLNFTLDERAQIFDSSNPRETVLSVTAGYDGLRAAGLSNANIAQLVHDGATPELIDEIATAGPEIARANIPPTDLLEHANDQNAWDWLHGRLPELVVRALQLAEKFEHAGVFTTWVDATFPSMAAFLRKCGWEGRIIVLDRASGVLQTIEPATGTENPKGLTLIRSDTYQFRLSSSSTYDHSQSPWETLFYCLDAHLEANGAGKRGHLFLLGSFDYFTRSESDRPGLGKP